MIRNAIVGRLSRMVRRWSRGAGGVLEAPAEYLLYFIGWVFWPVDLLLRLASFQRVAAESRAMLLRGVPLLRAGAAPDLPCRRARSILAEAQTLLRAVGITVQVDGVEALLWPEDVAPPSCGWGAFASRFFSWASARAADPPRITVYFVDDLGPLAGCAVPGADWIVVDLRTDGTTVAHELGHLADLWLHDRDPDNVMTDRPGGTHDRVTPFQAAMLRTSRFAVRYSGPAEARRIEMGEG